MSDFALEKGYTNCRYYVDDGVSGTTFEREGFKHMTKDIEDGLIGNYAEEKSQLNNRIAELLNGTAEQKKRSQKINNIYSAIEKYEQIDELTSEVLADFIDRIEVHERDDYPVRHRYFPRKIDVFFIGIGRFLG